MQEKNYEVIDQMFSAVLSQNESKERVDALRPQVEEAVTELIRQRGLPRTFTGVLDYNGFEIRVSFKHFYLFNTLRTIIYTEFLDLQCWLSVHIL